MLLTAFGLHQSGRFDEAEEQYLLILRSRPNQTDIWHLAGVLAVQTDRLDLAVARFRRVLALSPEVASYTLAAAAAFAAAGQQSVCEALLRRTLRLRHDAVEALSQLCDWLYRQGRFGEVLGLARAWSLLDPGNLMPVLRTGVIYSHSGDPAEARKALGRAARLDPLSSAAFSLAWLDAQEAKRNDLAVARLRVALAADPTFLDALHNMGCALLALARSDEAIRYFNRASRLAPQRADMAVALASAALYLPLPEAGPYLETLFGFEERFLRPFYPSDPGHANLRDPGRRLRIGYLSTDLHSLQPVSRNLEPVLRAHDRTRFELFVYSDVAIVDATVERFQALSDGWRMVAGLDDEALARGIREDGIDVLVVLAGHFDGNRLHLLARRPAPVLVSYHDVATTGIPAVDALIVDRTIGARPLEERFAERLVRLPSYVIVIPPDDPPPLVEPPLLRNGFPTFGCFNNPVKMSDAALELWARVLGAVPDARLRLKYQKHYDVQACRDRILDRLAAGGVDPARIEFLPGSLSGVNEHLALYDGVDVALDPFPFSGSTTTFEALFMGVPVVALPQPRLVARWSASILTAAGLPEFIAGSPDEYVAIAVAAATDAPRLAALRQDLRGRVLASSLCDAPRMARRLERVYRTLWRRWCARQDPDRDLGQDREREEGRG